MKILEGVKVVEFATHVVVPAATRVMAEWGAEVIKIERPKGDRWRNYRYGCPGDLTFSVLSSGKKMTSLNMKTPEGKEALYRMLEDADVFCTNVRPAAVKRLGLDYDAIHARFPGVVYCDFNGYGHEGPWSNWPGYDSVSFWSGSGILGDLCYEGEVPATSPTAVGDMATSSAVLSGILGALYHKKCTGEGTYVTSSLYASGIWCNFAAVVATQDGYDVNKYPRRRDGHKNALAGVFQCGDGRWLLCGGNDTNYDRCMEALGLAHMMETEEYATFKDMTQRGHEFRAWLKEYFKTKPAHEWAKLLNEKSVGSQVMATANEITKSEQAWANDYLNWVEFPDGGRAVLPKPPVHFPRMEPVATKAAGKLGADTSTVLKEHGFTDEEIQNMFKNGVAFGE